MVRWLANAPEPVVKLGSLYAFPVVQAGFRRSAYLSVEFARLAKVVLEARAREMVGGVIDDADAVVGAVGKAGCEIAFELFEKVGR